MKFPLKLFFDTMFPLVVKASYNRNFSSVGDIPGPNNRVGEQVPATADISIDYKNDAISWGASFGTQSGAWTRLTSELSRYRGVKRDADIYFSKKMSSTLAVRFAISNLLHQNSLTSSVFSSADQLVYQRISTPTVTRFRFQVESSF